MEQEKDLEEPSCKDSLKNVPDSDESVKTNDNDQTASVNEKKELPSDATTIVPSVDEHANVQDKPGKSTGSLEKERISEKSKVLKNPVPTFNKTTFASTLKSLGKPAAGTRNPRITRALTSISPATKPAPTRNVIAVVGTRAV